MSLSFKVVMERILEEAGLGEKRGPEMEEFNFNSTPPDKSSLGTVT